VGIDDGLLRCPAGHCRALPGLADPVGPGTWAGQISLAGGLTQVTWYSQPRCLSSSAQAAVNANGSPAPLGNGNNVRAFGGTFHLVCNPQPRPEGRMGRPSGGCPSGLPPVRPTRRA
jgi:hypothetical protein